MVDESYSFACLVCRNLVIFQGSEDWRFKFLVHNVKKTTKRRERLYNYNADPSVPKIVRYLTHGGALSSVGGDCRQIRNLPYQSMPCKSKWLSEHFHASFNRVFNRLVALQTTSAYHIPRSRSLLPRLIYCSSSTRNRVRINISRTSVPKQDYGP